MHKTLLVICLFSIFVQPLAAHEDPKLCGTRIGRGAPIGWLSENQTLRSLKFEPNDNETLTQIISLLKQSSHWRTVRFDPESGKTSGTVATKVWALQSDLVLSEISELTFRPKNPPATKIKH